jgi:serine/threonine protein kinase
MKYSFQDKNNVYFVLEYCPGGELYNLIKRFNQATRLKHIKYYAYCVAKALEYLHSKQLIYKDLKPENIVISKDGVAKLTDFGLCVHKN